MLSIHAMFNFIVHCTVQIERSLRIPSFLLVLFFILFKMFHCNATEKEYNKRMSRERYVCIAKASEAVQASVFSYRDN